jgi:hypothetical protein
MTISLHGGRWNKVSDTGITCRNVQDWVGLTGSDVASSNM